MQSTGCVSWSYLRQGAMSNRFRPRVRPSRSSRRLSTRLEGYSETLQSRPYQEGRYKLQSMPRYHKHYRAALSQKEYLEYRRTSFERISHR
jgi:hypothetical protein